jgi:formate hydrogenlyase subunit 3/multisubunit Na+/H+ antiporter MnhD subunit
MSVLYLAVVALPLMMALGMLAERGRSIVPGAVWLAPIPALILALLSRAHPPLALDWLLLGGSVGIDPFGRVFLMFTALLWSAGGAYAHHYHRDDERRVRFFAFYLLTLSGNLGLIVAQDVASFYAAFAVMTFAAYGLVVHSATEEARRAGRIYLAMAVVGEVMLLAAFTMAAMHAESLGLADVARGVAVSPRRDLIVALLLGGFGIKAGAIPLHVWLPLAHPVAPTPASAVLSGAMIKAGLLGWLRFLPLGIVALEGWGQALVIAGLVAAFFGVAVGVTQRDAKTALAYSSISQMGLINVALGIGLASSDGWVLALTAVVTYAVHHGLAKGALFLGIGVVSDARSAPERRWALTAMLFAALALAGAPLTSGAVAKEYLKAVTPLSPVRWPLSLDLLLGLAALGTTLLMARVLLLAARTKASPPVRSPGTSRRSPLWTSWLAVLGAVATVVWIAPTQYDVDSVPPSLPAWSSLWVAIWPILGGLLIAWGAVFLGRRARREWPLITPGDLLIPMERLLGRGVRSAVAARAPEGVTPVVSLGSKWYGVYADDNEREWVSMLERGLTRWSTAGLLFICCALLIAGVLVLGGAR